MSVYDDYEMTIGVECHVQLATKSKLFSGSNNDAREAEPNTAVDAYDWALPGVLPILNRQAVLLAVRAGKALNAEIAHISRFDRKHYFYPDLPKGYQISQMYQPIIGAGKVEVESSEGDFAVRIESAHLEEDAGKLTHGLDASLVDLNRAGTPLLEIVTKPDIHSAKQARDFAMELHKLMVYAGVSLGDLYHGNMRFDINVSVAKKGATKLGTRAEIKNLNSFKSVERAADYEFYRQVDLLEKGEKVVRETRGFDEAKQKTFSQRSKEEAQDYRYMPDPDIPPVVLSDQMIAEIQADMPLLPPAFRDKWQPLEFDESVVIALLAEPSYARFVSQIQDQAGNEAAKTVANWVASALEVELTKDIDNSTDIKHAIELAQMVRDGQVSSTNAKTIFNQMLKADQAPLKIAEENNLIQVSDSSSIEKLVDEVLASEAGQRAIADYHAGNQKALGFVVGQVMKASKGQANPQIIQSLLKDKV